MILRLPEAPALNRYYRTGRGHVYMSDEGRAYKETVQTLSALECRRSDDLPYTLATPLAVTISWHRGRKAGDLDGRFKVVLDALQGTVYANDSQIVEFHSFRHENKDDPHMQVVVEVAEWAVAIAGSARPPRTRRSSRRVRVRAA